jgi:hypothetical protein
MPALSYEGRREAALHAEGLCVRCGRVAEVRPDGRPYWRCLLCRVAHAALEKRSSALRRLQLALLVILCSTGLSAQTPVTLAWDASPTAVDGYRVYVGSDRPGVYMTSLDVGNVLEHTVTGLPDGTWYFVVVAGKGDLWSPVSNEVTVTLGGTTPPPPPPPTHPDPPKTPSVKVKTLEAISCRVTLTAVPPDASGGWRVQFKRGTVNFGTVDSTVPFERTSSVSAGVHSLSAVWTKTEHATVTYLPTTVNCAVAAAPAPLPTPTPTPIVTSPDGTRLPPAARVVDNAGDVWTLSGIQILRNGQAIDGWATVIAWCGGKIRVLGTDSVWYERTDRWVPIGTVDPCMGEIE